MRLVPPEIESKLRQKGLWPESWTARAGLYVVVLDIILSALQVLASHLSPKVAASLGGWVTFLSALAIVLFAIVGFRWLRSQILWRLRNRLIVTYVFIGVIPVVLLTAMSFITLYILAGQFASYIVASGIATHLRRMETANNAIANELVMKLERHAEPNAESLLGMRRSNPQWSRRQVCARYGDRPLPICSDKNKDTLFDVPKSLTGDFSEIVRDHNLFELRTGTTIQSGNEKLRIISSEPLDQRLMTRIAESLGEEHLGEITLGPGDSDAGPTGTGGVAPSENQPPPTFTVGVLPPQNGFFDREISFPGALSVVNWSTGDRQRAGVVLRVRTRPSILYEQLFVALGDVARGWETVLFLVAIVFAIIELLALWIGTRLTRSITSAVAQLYEATKHINRGDFSHRIEVKSNDQLATLANSFNSMTASIEKLVLEQKEKQRLENELVIAQEVQEQLFPKRISQLESLEVYGFCRPARTVSGDYYDFLLLNSERMILAVGDVSGKGISAALLMATIHSAVRAYSLERVPFLREPAAVGAAVGSGLMLASDQGAETSPAALLALLNHQLYENTPQEKYATLFLGIYDNATRRLTYSNGGHLPPILLSEDGSSQLLSCGGTVVGLFQRLSFPEATIQLRRGDIFLAYSDGVTEPENDYGEFGEERLIQIVRENRHLPLARIAELVTAAVDDWIGDNEQPDDVTLVLARAR